MKQVFLSAGIPGPSELPYGKTADPMLIHSAVRSLCSLVFGHGRIVWGGHPAITPMMWAACENLGVKYSESVHLYQSRFFAEMYPEENRLFSNVTYVDAGVDRESSLLVMRKLMLANEFEAGVFIGGKDGVLTEFEIFRKLHPNAGVVVLPSTGGAALILGQRYPEMSAPSDNFVRFMAYMADFIRIEVPPSNLAKMQGENKDDKCN